MTPTDMHTHVRSRIVERGVATKRRPRGACLEHANDRLDGRVGRQRGGRQTSQGENQVPRVENKVFFVCNEKHKVNGAQEERHGSDLGGTYSHEPIGKRSTSCRRGRHGDC